MAGGDFGQVKQFVNRCQQVFSGSIDLLQVLQSLAFMGTALRQRGKANHGIERSPDFVAHVGEKGVLGHVGLFRRFLGYRELTGTLRHQVLKVRPMVREFQFDGLALGHILEGPGNGAGAFAFRIGATHGMNPAELAQRCPQFQFEFEGRATFDRLAHGRADGLLRFREIEGKRFLDGGLGANRKIVDVKNLFSPGQCSGGKFDLPATQSGDMPHFLQQRFASLQRDQGFG